MIDIAKWLTDNVSALGLSDEEKALAQKLAAGTFGQRLGANIYPQEAVSGLQSTLDKQKAERVELEAANIAWQNQYFKDVSELGALDRLAAAGFDVTGLQPTRGGGARDDEGQTLTAADIDALVTKKATELVSAGINPVREGVLDYAEFIADAAPDYKELTGKRLDSRKFREFAFAGHKDGKFANLQQAFDSFTAEDRQKKADEDRKKWEADKEKEIEMRVRSRMDIPEAGPEHGVGGPFEAANKPVDAAAAAASVVSRDVNRQEFAKKFQDTNFATG
jgi:hypothetical protein